MNKAKVMAKLSKDGAEIEAGHNSYGDYQIEAWLPNGQFWNCKHVVGWVMVEKSSNESMASFWKSVWSEIEGDVIVKEAVS
jgi:hypothetical protein